MHITSIILSLGLTHAVAAHGGGQYYEIDGVLHRGNWDELNNTEGSIQRLWTWGDNIYHLNSEYFACSYTGVPGLNSYHAPHTAGSVISINYTVTSKKEDDGRPWTFGHSHGPMSAYLAACPDEGCQDVDLSDTMWFKIWHAGLLEGTWQEGYWAMRDVWLGANLDITTPKNLKSGKYLFRHEMINLEGGAAQFFPNCIQLDISGDGDRFPDEAELVAFPGAYDKDEEYSFVTLRGSEWFYTEHRGDTVYPLPGPPVWEG